MTLNQHVIGVKRIDHQLVALNVEDDKLVISDVTGDDLHEEARIDLNDPQLFRLVMNALKRWAKGE